MSSLIPHENLNEELVILSQSIQVINVRYNVFGVSLVEHMRTYGFYAGPRQQMQLYI